MTNVQKNEIVAAIQSEKNRLGSANRVANKCGVSSATISQMLKENWELISEEMWMKVANGVGYSFTGWRIAETTNYRMMQKILSDAKKECMFIPISYRAGAGKTEGLKGFIISEDSKYNYLLKCREWAKREFIENLLRSIGLEVPKGYISIDRLGQKVIDYFSDIRMHKPFLALDQANSLKPSALKFLIHLYNEMEDQMSVVICGTENLEKEIKRGVRYNKHGYDEIDSRFGRNYMYLIGATKADVKKICKANGITDRVLQESIFKESQPITKKIGNRVMTVTEDMRRVKRIIRREQMRLKQTA